MKVVTTTGTLVRAQPPGKEERPLTEDEAKQLAGECNRRAEALDIETRYEAVED